VLQVLVLIVYNKRDGSIEKLSKVNGLSDIDISRIEWSEEKKCLLSVTPTGIWILLPITRSLIFQIFLEVLSPAAKALTTFF
jgi:hypothetical protein